MMCANSFKAVFLFNPVNFNMLTAYAVKFLVVNQFFKVYSTHRISY